MSGILGGKTTRVSINHEAKNTPTFDLCSCIDFDHYANIGNKKCYSLNRFLMLSPS